MESPTRRAAAAGAAALLAAGLVAVVGAEGEPAPVRSDRITTVAQLKESIGVAAELDRQNGTAEIGGNTGGQATLTARTAC